MRTKFLTLLLMASLNFSPVKAYVEDDNNRTMAIALSPLSVIGLIDSVFLLKLSDILALTVSAGYRDLWLLPSALKSVEAAKNASQTKKPFEVTGGLGARFLLGKKGLNDSFYLEPRATFGYEQLGFSLDNDKLTASGMRIQPMLRAGWDWFWSSGFYMTLGGALGYAFYFNNELAIPTVLKDENISKLLSQYGANGVRIDLEWKLGFAF